MSRRATLVLTLSLVAGCAAPTEDDRYGDLEVTTNAPTAEQPFVTADGWSVDYERLLVHVASFEVAGADRVLTASAANLLVDYASPGPKPLLAATVRKARLWEDVHFVVAPVGAEELTLTSEIAAPEVEAFQKAGLAVFVRGTATRGPEKKTFAWGFTSSTQFGACTGGLTVAPDEATRVNVTMRGDVLFADEAKEGATTRFAAIAAADADKNGEVTLEELAAIPLETARLAGGAYGGDAANLAVFVEAQTVRLVGAYGSGGTCTGEPVLTTTE